MDDPIQQAKDDLTAEAVRAEQEREERRRAREERSRTEVAAYRNVLAAVSSHITAAPVSIVAAAGRGCERLPSAFEVLGHACVMIGRSKVGPPRDYGRCEGWIFTYWLDPASRSVKNLRQVAVAADGTAAFVPAPGRDRFLDVPRFLRSPLRVYAIGWYVDVVARRSAGEAEPPGSEQLARIIASTSPTADPWSLSRT